MRRQRTITKRGRTFVVGKVGNGKWVACIPECWCVQFKRPHQHEVLRAHDLYVLERHLGPIAKRLNAEDRRKKIIRSSRTPQHPPAQNGEK